VNKSSLIAAAITAVFVLAIILYRLLWAASSTASASALGHLPQLPKSWRRWLLHERADSVKH
jgi:hypothetical protein